MIEYGLQFKLRDIESCEMSFSCLPKKNLNRLEIKKGTEFSEQIAIPKSGERHFL